MKKILFGVAALGLLGLAGAGLGLKAQDAVEAKADEPEANVFLAATSFANPYMYLFNSTSKKDNASWPGVAMTNAGDGLYSAYIDTDAYDMVVFSDNGSSQTDDLTYSSSQPYYYAELEEWSTVKTADAGYYLFGSFNGWTKLDDNWKMDFDSKSERPYLYNKSLTFEADSSFKMKAYHFNGYKFDYYNATGSKYHDLFTSPEVGNTFGPDGDQNVGMWCRDAGTVTFDFAVDTSTSYYYFAKPSELSVTIGSESVELKNYIGNFDEVTAAVDGAIAGATLSIDGKTVIAKENNCNNLTADKKMKVGGNVEVFYDKFSNQTWVTGYAPASNVVADFCDSLLALGCGATSEQLAALNWDGEGVKAAINDATISLGDDKSYTDWGNVVNEAATRYVNLISNGLSPVDGVTLASRTVPSAFEATVSPDSPVLAISITFIAALVAISTFFIVRKRKEDR